MSYVVTYLGPRDRRVVSETTNCPPDESLVFLQLPLSVSYELKSKKVQVILLTFPPSIPLILPLTPIQVPPSLPPVLSFPPSLPPFPSH